MIIFISNIPENTRPSELFNFVNPTLKFWMFFKSGKVQKTEILYIHDKISQSNECHGLVHIDSAAAGLKAIANLNGSFFKNHKVSVREYFERHKQNDRRLTQTHVPAGIMENRRHQRRRGENVELIQDSHNLFCTLIN